MSYTYDLGGNIITLEEHVKDCGTGVTPDELISQFSYDPLKRLLTATGRESDTQTNNDFWSEKPKLNNPNADHTRSYTRTYDYDKVGNIKTLQHAATGLNFTRGYNYIAGINQLQSIDNAQATPTNHALYTYDEVGNQLQVNADRFYEWDVADQLKYFKKEASGSITTEAKYLYSGGQRLKKYVKDQQGNTEVTVYIDGVYEHRYRKNSADVLQEEQNIIHVMDGRSRIATKRIGDDFGDSTAAVKYNLENHLGTSTTRLDASGVLIDREEYYPFGDSSLRTFEYKRYRYVGKEKDAESGLYYYGARYYSAWTCRFISIDPLAHDYPYLNSYNYAGNMPIGNKDIDGMQGDGNVPVDTAGQDAPLPNVTLPPTNIQAKIEYNLDNLRESEEYVGMSVERLRALATQNASGYGALEPWERNIAAGNALEYAFSNFTGFERNFETFENSFRDKDVKPDFTEGIQMIDIGDYRWYKWKTGIMFEVKTTSIKEGVTLKTSSGQIGGEIDAVANAKEGLVVETDPVASEKFAARLVLVVPYGTHVAEDIIREATEKSVALYISYAFENVADGTVVFSNPEQELSNWIGLGLKMLTSGHIQIADEVRMGDQSPTTLDWQKAITTRRKSNENP